MALEPADKLLKQLASRSQGRDVAFTAQSAVGADLLPGPVVYPGPPDSTATAGVDVTDAIVALARLRCRYNPAHRRAEVQVVCAAGANDFTVTLNGTASTYAYAGGLGGEETVIDNLIIQIGIGGEPVTCTKSNGGGILYTTGWVLVIQGVLPTDLVSLAVSIAGVGAGTIGGRIEAEHVHFNLWAQAEGEDQMDVVNGGYDLTTAGGFNWVERLDVAGFTRLFIEVTNADGVVVPSIGPAGIELAAE